METQDHKEPVSLLLFDDETEVLDSLVALLKGLKFPMYRYASAAAFNPSKAMVQNSVSIVDLHMPGGSGHEVIEKLQALDPGAVYLAHTATVTVNEATQLMMKKAITVLEKPADPSELIRYILKAIEQVKKRGELLALYERVNQQLRMLSPGERKIALRCAVYHENAQIAEASSLSIRTVEGHRMNIANKIGKAEAKELYRELALYMINKYPFRLPSLFSTDDLAET